MSELSPRSSSARPMVLRMCRGILHHQQDAEDACQATFLVLAPQAHAIRKQEAVSSWLHGVAYRVASRTRAPGQAATEPGKDLGSSCSTNADGRHHRSRVASDLHDELHRLPEKYRAPLLLCYWEGKTRDEGRQNNSA